MKATRPDHRAMRREVSTPNESGLSNEGETLSRRHNIGDSLEVEIVKIVPGGYGLAFAENITIFVALAVAGDRLVVRLREIKGKTAFAEIEAIITPSVDRITPPCPYVGRCGGCDFQQMT